MEIKFCSEIEATLSNTDTLVCVFGKNELQQLQQNELYKSWYEELVDLEQLSRNNIQHTYYSFNNKPNLFLYFLDNEVALSPTYVRKQLSKLVMLLRKHHAFDVKFITSLEHSILKDYWIRIVFESFYLSNYTLDTLKTEEKLKLPLLHVVEIFTYQIPRIDEIQQYKVLCNYTNICKDLVNAPGDQCNPISFENAIKVWCDKLKIDFQSVGEKELRALGMNLLLEVNKGSQFPPKLLILQYRNRPDSDREIAIIGKGVTFDTGGVNLKPTGYIEYMHSDMAGGAVALTTLLSIAELKLKCNIIVVIPVTENVLGQSAYLPGQVIQSFAEKTVEIKNTDAEGRLILADAIAYTEARFKPEFMITVGTLTGESAETFDEVIAPYLTLDSNLSDIFFKLPQVSGEKLWPLPLDEEEYIYKLQSDIADIKNVASDYKAGTIVSAVFLKQFHNISKWVHLDIAGTAWLSSKNESEQVQATGFGVRTIYEAIKEIEIME